MPDPTLLFHYLCARLGVDPAEDDGMTTTEVAVITFLLVGAAIVVLGIIYAAAQNNAESIPEPSAPPVTNTTRGRRLRGEDGMMTSQVAILFPAVLLWIMLIVQYGLWWHAKQVANAAAAEAVDHAQVPAGSAAGEDAAHDYLGHAGNLTAITIEVDRAPTLVTAQVTGHAPQLVPGFDWHVAARSQGPVERFVPEPER